MPRPVLLQRREIYSLGEISIESILSPEVRHDYIDLHAAYNIRGEADLWLKGEKPMPLIVCYYAKDIEQPNGDGFVETFCFGYPVEMDWLGMFPNFVSASISPPQRLAYYFETNPSYRTVVKRTKQETGRSAKRRFSYDSRFDDRNNREIPFRPITLKQWDQEILDRVAQLPDHVLDVIGYREVFPRTEDEKREGK